MKDLLINKIDRAIESKRFSTGATGTEVTEVKLVLTDDEVKTFRDIDKYDTDNYSWDLEGNTLWIGYSEE